MRHRIRRSRIVRQVDVFDVDLPDGVDPVHTIAKHFHQFDSDLTGGVLDATLVTSAIEETDYDELHLEVVDRESAQVIPIRGRHA